MRRVPETLVLLSLLCSLPLLAAPFDPAALQAQLERGALRVSIPAGEVTIALDIERTTRTADGDLIVRARPAGVAERDGWAVLGQSSGHWYGNVRTGTRSYEIRHAGNGAHEIVERNADERAPVDLPPAPSRRAAAIRDIRADAATAVAEAEPVVVDVLSSIPRVCARSSPRPTSRRRLPPRSKKRTWRTNEAASRIASAWSDWRRPATTSR